MSHPHAYQEKTTFRTDALMRSGTFQERCNDAKIPVTRRQARKFLQKRGKAYRTKGPGINLDAVVESYVKNHLTDARLKQLKKSTK